MPALFLSSYIMENKDAYYKKLRGVTKKRDWQGWILYMLCMVEATAKKDRQRIAQIEKLMGTMGAEIQSKLPKIYSRDLMEVLFRLP